MDYTSVTASTWTKLLDATSGVVIIQPQNPTSFQWALGQPSAGESGFQEDSSLLVLNTGTLGEELWVYAVADTTFISVVGVSNASGPIDYGFDYNPTIINETGLTVTPDAGASYYSWQRVGSVVSVSGYALVEILDGGGYTYFDVLYPIAPDADSYAVPTGYGVMEVSISPADNMPTVIVSHQNEVAAGEQYVRVAVQNSAVGGPWYIFYSFQYTTSANTPPWA